MSAVGGGCGLYSAVFFEGDVYISGCFFFISGCIPLKINSKNSVPFSKSPKITFNSFLNICLRDVKL